MKKLIFRFNNISKNNFNNKEILGGKGANLAQMAKLGLPVPPGFTISTVVCDEFYKNNRYKYYYRSQHRNRPPPIQGYYQSYHDGIPCTSGWSHPVGRKRILRN